jgi:hypothetical protein
MSSCLSSSLRERVSWCEIRGDTKMPWIKTAFGRRDAPASRKRTPRRFAAGAAVIANLPVPAFAADLNAPPRAFILTGLYTGAHAGAWFAPADPNL